MTSAKIQATPAALDGFGTAARTRGRDLSAAAGANRGRLLGVSRRLDGFGVADELTHAYPHHARQALRSVDELAEVLCELGRVAGAIADGFRHADATGSGKGR